MSVLLSSKNIFLSTQPSGNLSNVDDTINKFRACLNNIPLQTGVNQYGKISLVDFHMYRNFYKVNETNNIFFTQVVTNGVSGLPITITIPPGDYRLGAELSTAVANAVLTKVKLLPNQSGASVSLIKPTTNERANQNGDGKLQFKLTIVADQGIDAIKFQCRNYNSGNNTGSTGDYNDSYALLGAKRITEQDNTFTNVSLSSVLDQNETDFTISGFYQMQDNTIPLLF